MLRRELAEGDELQRGEFAQNWKRLAFDIARGAETRANASEIGVVVAGVRHEFPSARRNLIEKTAETHAIECAGAGNAERAAGGREAFFRKYAVPGRLEAPETANLRSTDEPGAGGGANGPGGFEWIAN